MLVLTIAHAQFIFWLGQPLQSAIIDSAVSNLILALACIAVATGLRFYYPRQNQVVYIIFWCVTLAGACLLITHYVLGIFLNDEAYSVFLQRSFIVRFTISFLITGIMALITLLWSRMQINEIDKQRKADAEKLSRDAELFQLRQQLQPHFLFNSLNSINALISSQPERAKDMVLRLSEFLRGTIKTEDQLVNLNEEIHHLELYLEIEKVRFGHRLLTEIISDENCRTMKLPALLLQPIVENAIKFGLYDTTGEVMIRIHATCGNNQLLIIVQNPFDDQTAGANSGTGFGLTSVKRRLYLLFGRNDLLQLSSSENIFTAKILIPQ